MTDAYVHVYVDAGAVSSAGQTIADLDAVSDVHVVTGEFDVIAQLEIDDPDELPAVVADEIQPVSGVVETVTSVAFEPRDRSTRLVASPSSAVTNVSAGGGRS